MGRNVAEMELKLIASTVALGFEFELAEAQRRSGLVTREGFLRKPVECLVRMRMRKSRSGKMEGEKEGGAEAEAEAEA